MDNGYQEQLNRTGMGGRVSPTHYRRKASNSNIAQVASLETSQGFIEYYEDQEEVNRINDTLQKKTTKKRRHSPKKALEYSFQKGDYSFKKLKLKNLKNLHPLFANMGVQSSFRNKSQMFDAQYHKNKQVLI